MTQMNTFSESDVLLPYQKRWVADDSKLKIAEKSRRTGLTWAEAADAALTASLKKENGGSDHFYIGSNKEMAREFIDAVAMWAKAFNAAAEEIREEVITDEDKDILTFVVYFASGFKVKALSSNPGNIRGMQGNVTIDEAAFHEQLDEVLKAVTPLTTWGGKVRLISTHDGVDNPFNQLIQESRAGKKDYRIHTITLDDACNDGLYRRICQVRGMVWSPEAEAEWKEGLLRNTASRAWAWDAWHGPGTVGLAWLYDDREDIVPTREDLKTMEQYLFCHKHPATGVMVGKPGGIEVWPVQVRLIKVHLSIRLTPDSQVNRNAVRANLTALQKTLTPGQMLPVSSLRTAIGMTSGITDYFLNIGEDTTCDVDELITIGEVTWLTASRNG
ncbi:TPA: baseplate J/gp47 family protein [Escherichia coli]